MSPYNQGFESDHQWSSLVSSRMFACFFLGITSNLDEGRPEINGPFGPYRSVVCPSCLLISEGGSRCQKSGTAMCCKETRLLVGRLDEVTVRAFGKALELSSHPQEVLPSAKLALKAQAFRRLSCAFADMPIFRGGSGKGAMQNLLITTRSARMAIHGLMRDAVKVCNPSSAEDPFVTRCPCRPRLLPPSLARQTQVLGLGSFVRVARQRGLR